MEGKDGGNSGRFGGNGDGGCCGGGSSLHWKGRIEEMGIALIGSVFAGLDEMGVVGDAIDVE